MSFTNKSTLLAILAATVLTASAATPSASTKPLLVPGPVIEVPNSKGKFDFLQVDPVRRRLMAGHKDEKTADIFDLKTNKLASRVKTGECCEAIVDVKTGTLFFSLQADKRVAIIDPVTFKETGSIPVEGELDSIFFCPSNRMIYAAHDNGDHLWVIDPEAKKVVATIDIPVSPELMAFDAARDRLFLTCKGTNEVITINIHTNEIIAKWRTLPATGPHGVTYDDKFNRLIIAGNGGKMVVLDATDGSLVTEFDINLGVDQTAYDPSLRRVYCAGPEKIGIVQLTDEGATLIGTISTGLQGKNVAVDPVSHAVWMVYSDGANTYAKSWLPN
jgi:DNA-binding beta-propeller fold protein YncE